jgi:hypothetical protein
MKSESRHRHVVAAAAGFALGLLVRPVSRHERSYYDRETGIAFFQVARLGRHDWRRRWRRRGVERSEDRGWGMVDVAEGDEQIVGIELRHPRQVLPAEFLDALPPPSRTAWGRFTHLRRRGWETIKWRTWDLRRHRRWLNSPEGQAAVANAADGLTPRLCDLIPSAEDSAESDTYRPDHRGAEPGEPRAE